MPKKIALSKDTFTARLDKHVLVRMRTLALWQERTMQDLIQEACDAYIRQQASVSFKKHIKKQRQEYG